MEKVVAFGKSELLFQELGIVGRKFERRTQNAREMSLNREDGSKRQGTCRNEAAREIVVLLFTVSQVQSCLSSTLSMYR